MELASLNSEGTRANQFNYSPHISANGRYITFISTADNLLPGKGPWFNVYRYDRNKKELVRVSVNDNGNSANDTCYSYADPTYASISTNGRYVSFISSANNLVANDTNGLWDVFVRDTGPGVPETIEELIEKLDSLLLDGVLNQGTASSLGAILDNALTQQGSGNTVSSSNMMEAFINQVEAQYGKKIDHDTADMLIEAATSLIEGMNQ